MTLTFDPIFLTFQNILGVRLKSTSARSLKTVYLHGGSVMDFRTVTAHQTKLTVPALPPLAMISWRLPPALPPVLLPQLQPYKQRTPLVAHLGTRPLVLSMGTLPLGPHRTRPVDPQMSTQTVSLGNTQVELFLAKIEMNYEFLLTTKLVWLMDITCRLKSGFP